MRSFVCIIHYSFFIIHYPFAPHAEFSWRMNNEVAALMNNESLRQLFSLAFGVRDEKRFLMKFSIYYAIIHWKSESSAGMNYPFGGVDFKDWHNTSIVSDCTFGKDWRLHRLCCKHGDKTPEDRGTFQVPSSPRGYCAFFKTDLHLNRQQTVLNPLPIVPANPSDRQRNSENSEKTQNIPSSYWNIICFVLK